MFYLDWTYIFVIIGLVITLCASGRLKSTYAKYSKVGASCGLTGKDVAKKILAANGVYGVVVNQIAGELTDHYDPTKKVLNLSAAIYNGTSIASLGVAAHECGHAIQDNIEYAPLRLRSSLVPVANFGSSIAMPIILVGVLLGGLSQAGTFGSTLITIGIVAFSLAVIFQLVTLPVEYNASDRALAQLKGLGILNESEYDGANKVLKAAALTYVAAAASSILQLLRLVIIFKGGRDRD